MFLRILSPFVPKVSFEFWSAVGAGLGLIGSIYGASRSSSSARAANEMNLRIAREQMAFQERMRATQHQTEVADLRAAGLNPVLSATRGQGAGNLGGAAATYVNPDAHLPSSAQSAALIASELRLKKAQAKGAEESAKGEEHENVGRKLYADILGQAQKAFHKVRGAASNMFSSALDFHRRNITRTRRQVSKKPLRVITVK